MAHEMINGTFRQTNLPNESDEYLSKREELRLELLQRNIVHEVVPDKLARNRVE